MSRHYRSIIFAVIAALLLTPAAAFAAPAATGNFSAAASDTPAGMAVAAAAPASSANLSTAGESAAATRYYVVKRGDTLAKIAARYGVSIRAIMTANGLKNANFIYTGQRLAIPGGSPSPAPQPKPNPVPAPSGGKWIDVNLSQQRLVAYQGNRAVLNVLISSGTAAHPTAPGNFRVRVKIPSQAMSGPGYYLPGVPWVMYFMGANALHGTYWHHNFGHPMSHGCINLTISDAKFLYGWASVGTPVRVHY